MNQRGFARSVADRTGLSREESADVTWAVLEGLADQLSAGEARRLATAFPDVGADLKARRRPKKEARPIRLQEFFRQVRERTGLNDDDVRAGAGAVLAEMRQVVGEEEYGHLVGQLPAEYAGLAEAA
ncbi:MAG: DUF2267 domain-containing protein [Nocardiopsaceae bacterium]|jgi:uncharacterized protein (DUF2267 family)|nr:DUF2267 domain-containing protein [Nocardiopsaceae bacterium]